MLQIRRLPSSRLLYTFLITIILGVMIPVPHASGQDTTGKVVLSGINSDSFPTMGVEFEVYDPSGGFVTDLQAGDVTIQEDDGLLPATSLELLQPGVQLTIAFNLSPELSNRYAGVTRLANILERLAQWLSLIHI